MIAILAGCAARTTGKGVDGGVETPPVRATEDAVAEQVIERLARANQAWNDSCSRPNVHGLCVEFAVAASPPQRCGAPTLGRVVVHPRDPKTAAAAQVELADAMTMAVRDSATPCDNAGSGRKSCEHNARIVDPQDPDLKRTLSHALGAAQIARADADLEAYLGQTLPANVAAPTEDSKPDARLDTFMDATRESGSALIAELAAVKQYHDGEIILQAALRTSWVALHFADQLAGAELPATLADDGKARGAYCDGWAELAAKPRLIAVGAASYCKEHADASGASSVAAEACRDLFDRLKP